MGRGGGGVLEFLWCKPHLGIHHVSNPAWLAACRHANHCYYPYESHRNPFLVTLAPVIAHVCSFSRRGSQQPLPRGTYSVSTYVGTQ